MGLPKNSSYNEMMYGFWWDFRRIPDSGMRARVFRRQSRNRKGERRKDFVVWTTTKKKGKKR